MSNTTEKPGENMPKATKSATVTVACKIPNGMTLQLCKPSEHNEPVMGGGFRTVTQFHPVGDKVTVKGPASPYGVAPTCRIVGGYALTEGVDSNFFDAWMEQHKSDPSVKGNMIYAHERTDYIVDWAKDHKVLESGLQPLKQSGDARVPKNNKMKIESDEDQIKRRSNR